MSSLQKAIGIAGSAKELARRIGVSPQALSQWKVVPTGRVLAVESATGVSRTELRPDIYPAEASRVSLPEAEQ